MKRKKMKEFFVQFKKQMLISPSQSFQIGKNEIRYLYIRTKSC